jgi:two-component system, chemotaxis family, protein-glutamate methylesterase/glutaminase
MTDAFGAPRWAGRRPKVLVVDDSAPSRAAIAEALEEGGCEVVGRAMDGAMALRALDDEKPDVITCDLEMPRMDGFTFLRILQKTRPIPVIVITSDARPEAALLALELGARDFVLKPERRGDLKVLRNQLITRIQALLEVPDQAAPAWQPPSRETPLPTGCALVALGASTGGPRAIRDILATLKGPPTLPVIVVQHMPPRFTEAFALRLRKGTGLDIAEATAGALVGPGQIRIAPGGQHLRITNRDDASFRVAVEPPGSADRWVPSVDVLFESAVAHARAAVLGVVLTGMGRDGADGARALADANAPLWTESPLTAAIEGMPQAAADAHAGAAVLPIDEIAVLLSRLLEPL